MRFTLLVFISVLFSAAVSAQPFGIDTRVPNDSLLIDDVPPDSPGSMVTERVFPQLTFAQPVLITDAPDSSNRLFVVEQIGRIQTFIKGPDPSGGSVATFLDLRDRVIETGEQGLLGLAFDPDYATNGEFYVYYSWDGTTPGTSRISRFTNADPAGNFVDPATEEILLSLPQPFDNHNGGMIAFGPDNMLYIAFGDGGSGGDPGNRAQNLGVLFGKMLRIDVRATPTAPATYVIPPDNPFVSGPVGARPEIFAYGLRNPFRFSFDRLNGFLLAGDVGQNCFEEINHVVSGGNYGWKIQEGFNCFNPANFSNCTIPGSSCGSSAYDQPLVAYPRTLGTTVSGGYVYYGSDVPALYGKYIYGDFTSGRIWSLDYDGVTTSNVTMLIDTSLNISGFGQDASGEVYIVHYGGHIHVLRPSGPPPPSNFPTKLSDIPALLEAGSGADLTTSGIIPYEPSAKLWSDGSLKERFLALPGLSQIDFTMSGGWNFPEESAIIKNFLLPLDDRDPEGTAKRIETRLLFRKNSQWHGFTYEWNEEETDAQLLTTEKDRGFVRTATDGTTYSYTWKYPSRSQCQLCHTNVANGVLGLNTPQMNFDFHYPSSDVTDNQLRTLEHIGMFTSSLPNTPANLPAMPDPANTAASLQDRARAYLAANCSMCHQPGGTTPVPLDLKWETINSEMNAINADPSAGDAGISGGKIIKTGDASQSILWHRMNQRNSSFQMPPLATSQIDTEAVALIEQWIGTLVAPNSVDKWTLYH